MKKRARLLTCLWVLMFILAIPLTGFASTVGNTGDINALHGPGVFSLKQTRDISVEANFDAELVFERGLAAGDVTDAGLETSQWYMFRFGYRIFDRVEPYVRLGAAHLKAKWTDTASGKKVAMDTSSGFAWGLGIKALIYEFKTPKIKLICDGSYRTADLDPYKGYLDDNAASVSKINSRFVIREWQAALLAATDINIGAALSQLEAMKGLKGYKLSPYSGITYSQISGRLRMTTAAGSVYHPDNIESNKNVGIVVGCDLVGDDYLSLNVEGRFIDETALSAGLSMLF